MAAPERGRALDREILTLAVPAFATLIAEPMLVLADTWIIGRLGTPHLGGLTLASSVLTLVVGLSVFLAYGTTATVSRRLGAGDRPGALSGGVDGMVLGALIGLAVAVLLVPGAPWVLGLYGAAPEPTALGASYLRVVAFGLPAQLVMLAATGTFRGLADARTPLVLSIAVAALNLALNVTFVYAFSMGIAGAALGTAVAETVLGLTAAALVARRARGLRLAPSLAEMRQSLAVGFPLWLRTVTLRAALLLTTYVAAVQGAAGLAAHHIAMNVWNLLAYALDAIAIAGQTIIATALGAGDRDEARASTRLMTGWSVGSGVVLGVVAILARGPIARFFSTDPEVQRLVAQLLLVVGLTLGLAGYVYLLDGVLIGAGDGPYLAKAGLITLVVYAPLALVALTLDSGLPALLWLWGSFTLGFMGARAVTLGLRAHGDQWMRLGDS